MKRTTWPVWRVAASVFMLITIASVAVSARAQEDPIDSPLPEPVVVDPSIQAVWEMTDGQIASGVMQRSWAFGPEPIAAAFEYYPQSPTKYRKLVYYDKGRLDLVNPQSPAGSIWMVSGALLTTELLSGQIQLGEEEFVTRDSADIPLVGDLNQPNPVTYATLAPHSSVRVVDPELATLTGPIVGPERHAMQIGKQVTELLLPDGSIRPDAISDQGVTIASYEDLLGHNVASPFIGWAEELGIPALNILGLPVTEPLWIETEVDGVSTLVLIQAFERRTLTYTPTNPEGWRVESGNVGLHYRLWRGLERPDRPELARLAAEIPFGEEILTAARDAFIDPYIFVAISLNSTSGNPFETPDHGGHGILGARETPGNDEIDLDDPGVNATTAAAQFAGEMYQAWDWPTILSSFYLSGHAGADPAAAQQWAQMIVETSERLVAHYPPSGPRIDPVREIGKPIGQGPAAHYSPSYDEEWWKGAMAKHASWGNAVETWQPDPHGLYCVHPDYLIGERLKLEANDRVVECTIGDRVAVPHQIAWRSKWSVELSWSTFTALGLDRKNDVSVTYLGDRVIEPTPIPETTPTATSSATADTEFPGQGRPDGEITPPDLTTPQPGATTTPTEVPSPSATVPEATATAIPAVPSATATPTLIATGQPVTPSATVTPTATGEPVAPSATMTEALGS